MVREYLQDGWSKSELARKFGIGPRTIYYSVRTGYCYPDFRVAKTVQISASIHGSNASDHVHWSKSPGKEAIMDKAIVYFTRDGSTAIAVDYLAKKTAAVPVLLETRKRLRNFVLSGFVSASKRSIELAGDPWSETADATTIILAAPVWAGNGNPVMNSFIEKADFSGKKVYLLTLQADPKKTAGERVIPFLSEMVSKRGGTVAGSLAIQGTSPGKTAAEHLIHSQLEEWRID